VELFALIMFLSILFSPSLIYPPLALCTLKAPQILLFQHILFQQREKFFLIVFPENKNSSFLLTHSKGFYEATPPSSKDDDDDGKKYG
jgi:hypothetical protein